MPLIYLLRHCEYENPRNILPGRLPVPLSDGGKERARSLGEYFSSKNIAKIYSSAVERCKQTAEIVSQGNIPLIFDSRLLETLSAYQGYWERNTHSGGYHFFSHRSELGGENLEDIRKRIADFWDEVTGGLNENIIICSHGDPLQVLYSYVHKLPLVADNAQESTIPGWMEKGEFIEILWENDEVVETREARSV